MSDGQSIAIVYCLEVTKNDRETRRYFPMLFALYFLACIAGMALLFHRFCMHVGRIHINPIFGLLVGIFFYVLLPGIFIYNFAELIDQWTVYGYDMSQANAEVVIAFTAALLLALNLGAAAVRTGGASQRYVHTENTPPGIRRLRWTSGASWPATLTITASFLLFTALSLAVRDALFSGYDSDVLENSLVWEVRGAMSSAYSMFYVALCLFILRRRHNMSRKIRFALILSFGFCSVILLSMGARLYVAMALLSLLSLKSVLSNGIPGRQLLMYSFGGAILMGSVGVLRSGSLSGLESVLRNLVLEPLLTSISLYTLLNNNASIWIGQVHMVLADFQALLPSVLFPGKAGLFERLDTYGYRFEAPVGGYHLYFSGLINFGYLGMFLIAIWAGYVLARISRRPLVVKIRTSTLVTSIYLSGALAFTVFRDPFFIGVVKNVFFMAVILPVVLTSFMRLSVNSSKHSKRSC